jgi:hypothetical protein
LEGQIDEYGPILKDYKAATYGLFGNDRVFVLGSGRKEFLLKGVYFKFSSVLSPNLFDPM